MHKRSCTCSGYIPFCISLWLVSCLFFVTASAFAEGPLSVTDFAGLSLEELSEVVVESATRFPEHTLYAPSSTTRVSEAEWRKRGARRTLDAISHVPGVFIAHLPGAVTVPVFRGVASTSSNNGFAMQLDGVPLNMYSVQSPAFIFPEVPLGNLEAIEVTRGPGSALYGTDAMNGTVALKSWSSDRDTTQVDLKGGTFGYHAETVRTSQALDEDWRLTMVGTYQSLSNRHQPMRFTSGVTGEEVNAKIANSFHSGGYLGKISGKDLEFAYHYLEHHADEAPGHPPLLFQSLFNGTTSNRDAAGSIYRVRWTPELTEDLALDLKSFYVRGQGDRVVTSGPTPGGEPGMEAMNSSRHADHRAGIDAAIKKPFHSDRYQALLGYAYDWMENRSFNSGRLGMTQPAPGDGIHRDINSLYGQLETLAVEDLLRITLGSRYDYYSDFGGQISPRAAAVVSLTNTSVIKFMYGRAFRAPSMLEQIGSPGVVAPGNNLSPEEVETYEVAYQVAEHEYNFGITGFYNEATNRIEIVRSDAGPEAFRRGNNAESRSFGGELEAGYAFDLVSLAANYTYAWAYQSEPERNTELYLSYPRHALNLSAEVTPLSDLSVRLLNTMFFSMRSLPQVVSGVHDKNLESLPSYWRTDVHIAYQLPLFNYDSELYLFLEDIFDREDVLAAVSGIERGVYGSGFAAIAGITVNFQ